MPMFSVVAGVLQTRVYTVHAVNIREAEGKVKDEYEVMEYDILNEEVDSMESHQEE